MAQYILYIYRPGAGVVASKKVQDDTVLTERFFGQSEITSRIESQEVLDIQIGDYTRWDNKTWKINQQPNITKNSSNNFVYEITFESSYYDFVKVQYLSDTSGEFYLTGDAEAFIDLIITNMNRIFTGFPIPSYTKGTIDQSDTSTKTLHFKDENCRQIIQRICSEFSGEMYFIGNQINFTDKLENATGVSLEYRSGLRNISKIAESEKNIVTRVYGYGSEKNLGTNYRSGKQRLEFDNGGNNYLENNVATYGTIEKAITFEEIFPHRTGEVTAAVVGGDELVFDDSGMDFDVNSFLIDDVTAKVHFNTGDLAGYEFEILTYDNANKRFTIIAIKTAIGIDELPNATLKPATNDEYVILDITMPGSYITTAETALEAATQAYLDDNSEARLKYEVTADNKWFERFGISFHLADTFTIVDTDISINATVRITELSYPLYDPFKYTITLSNFNDSSFIQTLYDDNVELRDDGNIDKGGDIPNSYRNWRTDDTLRNIIIAPDGYIQIGLLTADNIQVGRISSEDGNTYFDLDTNVIVMESGAATIAGTNITSIEDGADVTGDHTAQDIINLPDTPAGAGLYVDATHLGYYDGGAWKSYIENNGRFYFTGDANNYVQWNGSSLSVKGTITITGGSGIGSLSDAGDLAVLDEVGTGEIDTTVISGGKIVTGLLTATNIQTGTLTGRTVQTASSGQRVVISQADNTLRFHSATASDVIIIDDNIVASRPGMKITDTTNGVEILLIKHSVNNFSFLTENELYITTTQAASWKAIEVNASGVGSTFWTKMNGDTYVKGALTVDGTVDGRDVSVDGSKLDGIASGATVGATWSVNITNQPATFPPSSHGIIAGHSIDGTPNDGDYFRYDAAEGGLYWSAT